MPKIVSESPSFFFLENLLVIPKPALVSSLNKYILEKYGNANEHSLVNAGNLEYAIDRLVSHNYGEDKAKNVVYVSRELIYNIAKGHPFAQGNKRTALLTGLTLLGANSLEHILGKSAAGAAFELRAFDEMMAAQLMEAIAAWQENYKIPELKQTIEERMREAGLLKQGKEASEAQIKQYLGFVLSKQLEHTQVSGVAIHAHDAFGQSTQEVFSRYKKAFDYLSKK